MTILLPERRQDRSISFLPRQPVRRVAKRQTHPKNSARLPHFGQPAECRSAPHRSFEPAPVGARG